MIIHEPNQPLFVMIDSCLQDFVGHHFEYDHSLAQAARSQGFEPIVLAHQQIDIVIDDQLPIKKTFSCNIWRRHRLLSRLFPGLEQLIFNIQFYQELKEGLSDLDLKPGSIILAHMITERQIFALAYYISTLPAENDLTIILLLRYQPSFYHHFIAAQAFRLLERSIRRKKIKVRLATDTDRLAKYDQWLTSIPIEVLPIPHTMHECITDDVKPLLPKKNENHLRLVSMGNARDEKGILEILDAIRLLQNHPEGNFLEFVLQCNHAAPDIHQAILKFQQEGLPNVSLIFQSLNTNDYYALLNSANIVLLPYWHEIYEARSSGVFTEAVAAGKVVIVTEDTWMSDQLKLFAGGGELCKNKNPLDLKNAILKIGHHYPQYIKQATLAKEKFLQIHNPHSFIRSLTHPSTKVHVKSIPAKKIAVLYPWDNLLERKSGASIRTNLLIEYLSEHGDEIRVLHLRRDTPNYINNNIKYEAYNWHLRYTRVMKLLFKFILLLRTGGKSWQEEFILWNHILPTFDRYFPFRLREIAQWADVIFLEYTFWASILIPICRELGTRVILTNHDILSAQVTRSRWLYQKTAAIEFSALKAADEVVCVSLTDQQFFQAHHLNSHLIYNPINYSALQAACQPTLAWTHLPRKKCLFVGTNHPPNIAAVNNIRQIAKKMQAETSHIGFIIVGTCADPTTKGNFIALGKVDDQVLHELYQLADIIIIPLVNGTGMSVKTIEAFAIGKPVLGTDIAFRGIPVVHEKHCIIENDLNRYPELIKTLIHDEDKLKNLKENARQFAKDFDYKKVYNVYLSLM